MTTRLIEKCFDLDNESVDNYSIVINSVGIAIIVDPTMIEIEDLKKIVHGQVNIIRVRRPGWGQGIDFNKYIKVIGT